MRKEFLGYDPRQVDAFLARCLATPGVYRSRFALLRGFTPGGERVTAEEIRDVRFSRALLGYRIRDVDGLLDEIAEAVELTTWHVAALTAGPRTISLLEPERESASR